MVKINYNTNSLTNTNKLNIELNSEHEKELENRIISLINLFYSEKNILSNLYENKINIENYSFIIKNNEDINKLVCLSNVTEIFFDDNFNSYINLSNYNFLKKIIFGSKFNSSFILPNSVSEIIFGDDFNLILLNLSSNLKIIHFGNEFNQSVYFLPESIEIIKFGKKFNQPVNNLPKNLIELHFNSKSDFNYPIDNLPCKIKKLYLGKYFNQPINYLPSSLEILEFTHYSYFNQSINNLPYGIKKLMLPYNYNGLIDNISNSIEELIIPSKKNLINKFPNSLKFLSINIGLVEILNKINFDYLETLTVIDDVPDINYYNSRQSKKIINPDKIKLIIYKVHYSYKNPNLTWIIDETNKNDYVPIHNKYESSYTVLEIRKVKK